MRRSFRFADPFSSPVFRFLALRHQTERSTQSGSGGWLRQWREKNKIDVARSAHGVKNHSREPTGEVTSLSSPAGRLESVSKASANKAETLKRDLWLAASGNEPRAANYPAATFAVGATFTASLP
jgi:hypothetical protein